MVHWADVVASGLHEMRPPEGHVFATAITPSGPIHVGNMREVLTTEAIFRATKDQGSPARLLYIADDYDPLRKVYPFLEDHPSIDYAQHVGKPLKEVPCPCGDHDDYALHFLEPFLQNLRELGIEPEVLSAYQMYHDGLYKEHIIKALDRIDEVRQIIEEVSKRQLPKRWAPFNPQCPSCRRISGVEVLDYEYPVLHARCAACQGDTADPEAGMFQADVTQGGVGKLPWRVDWPARWDFLGVTFEAFGKDHGAKGGSWDSGVRLVREVFDGKEPHHVMYEFLNLKGKGAMHSSTGLAVSAEQVLRMTPPEVLRYLLVRQSPRKHIDFDPGLGVLQLVDDFDKHERIHYGLEENPGDVTEVARTYQLSIPGMPSADPPKQISYRHLVTIAQMARDDAHAEEILHRAGAFEGELTTADRERLTERLAHVRYWLRHFAPENVRFQVQASLPPLRLTGDEKTMLQSLGKSLATAAWDGQHIHDAVYAVVESEGVKPQQVFRPVYQAILGQDRGPRAGFFLASLEKDWVLERLAEAAA